MNADTLTDRLAAWPERPPSEVEWEDLLYRLELMVRALRVTLEDAPAEDERLAEPLRDAIDAELRVYGWLHPHTAGEPLPDRERQRLLEQNTARAEPAWLAERFASLRLRNFAMLQRRGLGVWDWAGELPGGGPHATAYQLFGARMRADGELLATLRDRLAPPDPARAQWRAPC